MLRYLIAPDEKHPCYRGRYRTGDDAKTFLNWVERTYEIPNPLKRIQKLPVPINNEGPRAYTENELVRLYAVSPRRRFFYRLMTFTGLRHKEARRLLWSDVRLDGNNPGIFLRPEATKSRRADWLPILSHLVPELIAARPAWAKDSTKVFHRGVPNIETLNRDFAKAGIAHTDARGRAAGFHTFRRTFITMLQKRGVPSRVIMQLARHKSLRLTDWTYTDSTQLPLREGMETLANIALLPSPSPESNPRSSPLKSGQSGVLASKAVQSKKLTSASQDAQAADLQSTWDGLDKGVQDCPQFEMVGEQGLERNSHCEAKLLIIADLVDC